MRPPQNNKRMRGRSNNNNNNNRRGPNPLTRSYESNGPDVKVRGTAAHIAEKYVQLARDAHVAGDPVAAESYLQHAEHYFRLIAAAQLAQNPPPRMVEGVASSEPIQSDDGDDEDFDGGINDRFTYRAPQAYVAAPQGQPFAAENGAAQADAEQANGEQPYLERQENGRQDNNRQDNNRQDNSRQDMRPDNRNRFDNRNGNRFEPRRDNRDNRPQRNEYQRNDPARIDNRGDQRGFEARPQENGRYPDTGRPAERSDNARAFENGRFDSQRRDRPQRPERPERGTEPRGEFAPRGERGFDARPERPVRSFTPEIADVQPILPSFITAPVRVVAAENEPEQRVQAAVSSTMEEPSVAVPKVRRKRKVVAVSETGDSDAPGVDTTAAE